MAEHFTPFYEWVAGLEDLTLAEALVLCRIKMWGNAGCFEKYSTLARMLKLGQRTVIRAVMSLREKDYIKVRYLDKARQKRILLFNFERTNLPIIDQKPMPQRHRLSANQTETYATEAQDLCHRGTEPMPERHSNLCHSGTHTISCTKQDKKLEETTGFLADVLTTQEAEPLRGQEFEAKRQKLKADLLAVDKARKKK